MLATNYSHARAHLAGLMDKVCEDRSPIIITSGRKSTAVVMMSLEDYDALAETDYLLRSPANAKALAESIAQLEAGKGIERKLFECD